MFDQIWQQVQERSIALLWATVAGFVGWAIGYWRARQKWTRREFFDRLNVSLNLLLEGKLQIRTLSEKHCDDVFLNKAAAKSVVDAARRTTPADPVLPLPKADYWYYLNAVLNDISEQFAEGHLRRAMGLPVKTERFVLCLTCEADGNLRMRKVRAMVIPEAILKNMPLETPLFDSPHHQTRWKTLHLLAANYPKFPERFITVELCVGL